MPNQRAIAKAAGVSQAAVSKALRGDRTISEATRRHIEAAAEKLGYRQNAFVSSLMAHIRSGRSVQGKGCIAVLVDGESQKEWMSGVGGFYYRQLYRGIAERARALGFSAECFFLKNYAANIGRLDRVLQARGISGLILTPLRGLRTVSAQPAVPVPASLSWERYAVCTIAYSWESFTMDRVTTHHRHNVEIAFRTLRERGYARIGMSLPPEAMEGVDYSWRERCLLWYDRLPEKERIPLFVGKPGVTPVNLFKAWLAKWKPEALVCLLGHEKDWLDELGIRLPRDMGMVCVNRPPGANFTGIEEQTEVIGAVAVETVVTRIQRNEYGSLSHPRLTLIQGKWAEGETLAVLSK